VICFDASVAVKLVLPEDHSESAKSLYAAADASGDTIVAPYLLPFEVSNINRKRMVRNAMSRQDAEDALNEFLGLRFTLLSPPGLHLESLGLADDFGLPATYDAHYVVLAHMVRCDLWTDDTELIQIVRPRYPFVRAIEDYSPPMTTNGSGRCPSAHFCSG
jgi:predicted nucleic acid-binding protein